MTPNSIRQLVLQPFITGKPGEVCLALAPVFTVAQTVTMVARSMAPQTLARLTWGMSPALRDGVQMSVVLLVGPNRDSEWIREFERGWSAALQSKIAAHRLSALKFYLSRGQLRVRVCADGPHNAESLMEPGPEAGLLVLSDANGDSVALRWKDTESKLPPSAEVRVQWSFGDPLRVVPKLQTNLHRLASEACDGKLLEFERLVVQCIETLPLPVLPWEERFEEAADELGIVLYDHQRKAIEAWFDNGCRGIFKMCTGAGKTISSLVAARRLAERELAQGRSKPPVVVTVPTRVLADQWIQEIRRLGFSAVLKAYESVDRWHHIVEPWLKNTTEGPRFIVSTYCTFADERFLEKLRRAAAGGVRALWIADEMHNLSSSRLLTAMMHCSELFPFRLALSATPDIEGNPSATERLRDYFGRQCASYELADGIKDGVLCPYRYYPIPAYLAPEVGQRYITLLQGIDQAKPGSPALLDLYRQSRDLLRTSGIQIAKFRDILVELRRQGGSPAYTLIYCPPGYGSYGDDTSDEIDRDPDECKLIEEVIATLRENGVSASSILGNTPGDQRREILRRFGAGTLEALCAIGCLDEGIDVPSIKRAVVLYSVDREKQFVQRRGRILRQPRGTQGKLAEIYDLIILPHGSSLAPAQAEALLEKEMRRYRTFAFLAQNRGEAEAEIARALSIATGSAESPEQLYAVQI